jgi:hypothetical protein
MAELSRPGDLVELDSPGADHSSKDREMDLYSGRDSGDGFSVRDFVIASFTRHYHGDMDTRLTTDTTTGITATSLIRTLRRRMPWRTRSTSETENYSSSWMICGKI